LAVSSLKAGLKVRTPTIVDEDYAYILGALRDACVYLDEYELKFVQKSREWLEEVIKPRLQSVFNIPSITVRRRNNSMYEIKINSKSLIEVLISHASVNHRPMPTPPIILKQPAEIKSWYIAGFYDAEGDKNLKRIRFWHSWNERYTCPPLEDIGEMLREREIETKLYKLGRRHSNLYEFCLEVIRSNPRNVFNFLEFIPLQHPGIVTPAPRKFRRA